MRAEPKRPFLESRGLPVSRFLVWLFLALVVTTFIVLLGHQLQQRQFWPIVLAPLVLGGAAGLGYAVLARVARVPHPWACAVTAGVLTLAGDAALFRLAYAQYSRDLTASVRRKQRSLGGTSGLAGLIEAVPSSVSHEGDYADRYLQIQTGRGGFAGFVLWRMREGVRFGSLSVRGPWMVLVWTAEWLAWATGACAVVWWAASQPFCKRCQSWYDRQQRGRLTPDQAIELLRVIPRIGDPKHRTAGRKSLEYELLACQEGCSEPLLILEEDTEGGFLPLRRKPVFKGFLQPAERVAVRDVLQGPSEHDAE